MIKNAVQTKQNVQHEIVANQDDINATHSTHGKERKKNYRRRIELEKQQ